MARTTTIEERVAALEERMDSIQHQLAPAGKWWERFGDSSIPDDAWEELARFGREFRDSDRPPESDELEGLGDLMEPRHGVVIYWSYERRVFVAESPQLPDCCAEGASYQQALENLLSVMGQWLQSERTRGHEIPWPKRRLLIL
jgi:predicted RNase H-like HicB family nuclease